MVIGVNVLLALPACQGGDHLINIHIGAGAGTGLKQINGELIGMFTCGDGDGGFLNGSRFLFI